MAKYLSISLEFLIKNISFEYLSVAVAFCDFFSKCFQKVSDFSAIFGYFCLII